ncbi:MAG: NUDIX domain-containing protein [Candidatus Melainabacteria bacterium]|nr:NUDIX domain-containing protein [Candidatus Melainabacteria bacterium]
MSTPKQGFKVRVGVVVVVEKQLLLVRQNGRPFWVLPGGTLEPGEGLADCAIRELKEEIDWDISVTQLLGVADFITPSGKQTVDVFFMGHYHRGPLRFTPPYPENIDEIALFPPDCWGELNVQPQVFWQQWQQRTVATPQSALVNEKTSTLGYLGVYGPQ